MQETRWMRDNAKELGERYTFFYSVEDSRGRCEVGIY